MRTYIYSLCTVCLIAAVFLPAQALATNIGFEVDALEYFKLGFKNKQTGVTDFVLDVDSTASSIQLNLDTAGFLSVQGNLGGTFTSAAGTRLADFGGSLDIKYRAYQETDAATGTTYWTSQHTDLGGDMRDEQAGGYLGLQFSNLNGFNAETTLGFGLDLKMTNISSQAPASTQNAYRELVDDGPFSFVLGELQAFKGDTIFKTWLYAGEVAIGGTIYEVAGDIHTRQLTRVPGTEVPEPSTLLLLGGSMIGIFRRKFN